MTVRYSLFSILILLTGIALTVITIMRIRSGKISLPQWAKIMLVVGMILSQIIIVLGMMPPSVYQAVEDTFIHADTRPATPIDPPLASATPDPVD